MNLSRLHGFSYLQNANEHDPLQMLDKELNLKLATIRNAARKPSKHYVRESIKRKSQPTNRLLQLTMARNNIKENSILTKLAELETTISRRASSPETHAPYSSMQLPVIMPIYIPYPSPQPVFNRGARSYTMPSRNDDLQDDDRDDLTRRPPKRNRYPQSFEKAAQKKGGGPRKQAAYQRFQAKENVKQVFRRIVFIIIFGLRVLSLHRKFQEYRKQLMPEFWPRFPKLSRAILRELRVACLPYTNLALIKGDVKLKVTGEQSGVLLQQKLKVLSELLMTLCSCLQKLTSSKQFSEVAKFLHTSCKNGSILSQGLLLTEELEYVCLTSKQTLLANVSLQKAQLIRMLFLKLLLYNFLLQPWKYPELRYDQENEQLQQNVVFVGSLLYQVLMTVHGDLIDSPRSQVYRLGNIKKNDIKTSSPLLYKSAVRNGEIIAGLIGQQYFQKYLPVRERFPLAIKAFEELVTQAYRKVCDYHREVKKKFINF